VRTLAYFYLTLGREQGAAFSDKKFLSGYSTNPPQYIGRYFWPTTGWPSFVDGSQGIQELMKGFAGDE
jgi:hypothetical protein